MSSASLRDPRDTAGDTDRDAGDRRYPPGETPRCVCESFGPESCDRCAAEASRRRNPSPPAPGTDRRPE